MNAEFTPARSTDNAIGAEQRPTGACDAAPPLTETLTNHLMDEARRRVIHRSVAGGRFCAVMLDNGSVGVANLCPEVCGCPSRQVSDDLLQPGTPAAEALATLSSREHPAVGLATANALANRWATESRPTDRAGSDHTTWRAAAITQGDLLDVLELRPDDRVGMVGCFGPLIEPIRRRVRTLSIFERGARLSPDLFSEEQAAEILPRCSVALITATTLINGTIDAMLAAAASCREIVLLGPSTPLVPEIFRSSSRRVTLLAGVVVTHAEELLRTVAQGGSTRDFKGAVAKVNVRVNAAGERPPSR